MILGSLFVIVFLAWAFDYIRAVIRWILPPIICVIGAFWINFACRLGSFEDGFYQLIIAIDIPPATFVSLIPWLALYAMLVTFLHCFRCKS